MSPLAVSEDSPDAYCLFWENICVCASLNSYHLQGETSVEDAREKAQILRTIRRCEE